MASNFLAFHQIATFAAGSGHRNSNTSRQNPPLPLASSSSSWWSPLFDQDDSQAKTDETEANSSRSKFVPGGFTEEKARRLRMMTTGNQTFHDAMYHSSIASRLASDFSRRSDR